MSHLALGAKLAALAIALPAPALAADAPLPAITAFRCEDGGALTAQFSNQGATFVAIVNAGDGPHALAYVPFTGGGPVKLTWTDGTRTLTWSPGVQIMFHDARGHRICGRGHKHEAPAADTRRS
ncbi:hypothetical protein [Phenylobacterium sp.]|uniref:hypothetical protein n=1 Tax=Phenylobacterium sp. TaxID=1871053 RepID=UPI0025CF9B49|nr:hypothetical protein [Phenylobacterium sp.]MBX3486155.1 hypothetical protein [Phenylobacterium sp.]MCW5761176.1 hypothetical protein [Phenylobacterium sp.]